MTSTQRHAAFDRFFVALAKRRSLRLGLGYLGTIRKLPPPPLPGEPAGATRYFLNAVANDGSSSGLVELGGAADLALRKAERWAATGLGPAPALPGKPGSGPKLKRKV
jgi:hypothetical protein